MQEDAKDIGQTVTADPIEDVPNKEKARVPSKYLGSRSDQIDMSALGREQVLRRNFRFISILGFGCTLIATWEIILTVSFGLTRQSGLIDSEASLLTDALTDGGTAGLIWGFVVVFVGVLLVFASLAEMASMAPTSGGQYHWVSEFAPRSCQRFLSYMTGWLCATGWQCAIVSIAFSAGTILQGLIVLNYPDYKYERWHGTLLTIAVTLFSIVFNTFLAKRLPFVEALVLILHVVGLFAIIIPLWVLAPRNNAKAVFTEFNNAGGWNSAGTATMIGLPTTITAMIGYDCSVHMSEEIRNASETLPKAIMSSVIVNGTLGFVMLVTICFTLGDVKNVLASETKFPFIQVFFNTTQNYGAANTMTAIIILTLMASTITEVATASRQLWSFARDRGVPFSSFFGHVTAGWNIPLNAVIASLIICSLLSLINIGSAVALQAFISLTISSLLASYIVTISCVLLKRLRGQPLPPHRWTLGRFGMAINIASLVFLIPLFVFAFFPLSSQVDPESMNWSIVMFGGMSIFSTVYYLVQGRHSYIPPVALVKRDF